MRPPKALRVIHINRNTLASNLKHGRRDPVCRLQEGTVATYGHEIDLLGPNGEVLASVVCREDDPLPCGARVWVETELECRVRHRDDPVRAAA